MKQSLALVPVLVFACWLAGSVPGAALDNIRVDAEGGARKAAPSASRSSGLPWDGRLDSAVRLNVSDAVRLTARTKTRGYFFGTSELVGLLESSARAVAARWPGSQLYVGDISGPQGGKLRGHHSHRSGRDADLAFFMRDDRGRNASFGRFIPFGIDGVVRRASKAMYFDDSRNWALVASLLRDRGARVQYIFVAQALRTRLLMEGRRRGEGDAFLRRAAAVLVEPKEAEKHDDHFHVRIYCPHDDRPGCYDNEPYWPWYDGPAPPGGYAELPIVRWKLPSVAVPRPPIAAMLHGKPR